MNKQVTRHWGMFTREGDEAVQSLVDSIYVLFMQATEDEALGKEKAARWMLGRLGKEAGTEEADDTDVRDRVLGFLLDGDLPEYTADEAFETMNEYVQGKTEILKEFSVKGYKSWTAREGVGAQTTLYKDGKKIGWCTDEGNGGEVDFRANTVEDRTMVFEFVKGLPQYKFNDYWKEQYGEEWDGAKKSELRSWKVFDFANVMLKQAEEGIYEEEAREIEAVLDTGEPYYGGGGASGWFVLHKN